MNRLILLCAVVGVSNQAFGDRTGGWEGTFHGGASGYYVAPQTTRPAAVSVAPVAATPVAFASQTGSPAVSSARPLRKPLRFSQGSQSVSVDQQTLLQNAAYAPTIDKSSSRCPDPIQHPLARQTPVHVVVDQSTQNISIYSPDGVPAGVANVADAFSVSTGGGLKIPNGKIDKPPYCARTPAKNELVISAVTAEMFAGTGCTEDEIRAKSTVFDTYYTRTFSDANGNPIPMDEATRITGGIFFHVVPPSYRGRLGQNVSGECVRLSPATARFIQDQVLKYGAIRVTITEPPSLPYHHAQYCDQQMVETAKYNLAVAKQSGLGQLGYTGTEGIYGGSDDPLANALRNAISGGSR